MNLLTVSDKESPLVYSPRIVQRFSDVDLVIGCGDLSYFYLEFIISSLDIPLYFVRGNHAEKIEYSTAGERTAPWGAVDLHKKVRRDPDSGLILAGVEGSVRYKPGDYQYSQLEMWLIVLQLVPRLLWNKIRYGRYLDIFVSHAPPWGVHDGTDRAHQGIKAFRWLIETFQPDYHFHGHVHIYRPDVVTETLVGKTHVVNAYGFRELVYPI
jgi:hypothetical protein